VPQGNNIVELDFPCQHLQWLQILTWHIMHIQTPLVAVPLKWAAQAALLQNLCSRILVQI
jgi:hypothetical protein